MAISEKEYWKETKKIEDEYYSIISVFDLNFPKPLNLKQEKKKFFQAIADDLIYNPKFTYEHKKYDEKALEKLKSMEISLTDDLYNIKRLYKERIEAKINEVECHKNWGKPISTEYVIKYRGKPSRLLLAKAKLFCKSYKRETVKFKTITVKDAGQRLKKTIESLTKSPVKVVFASIPSKVNINPFSNTITLNPNERFTTLDVKRLKVHEIGVHYTRYINAKKIPIRLFETGTANYIETEEGLAVYMEEVKGVSSKSQFFIYAGRVIATFYALKYSFYEVYQILRKYGFKREDAFAITFRAKRNICDTSKKGGFTKDYVYFSGYYKVKNYARWHDVNNLFIGKIKISDVRLLKKFIKKKGKDILDK